jgi:hypothetical protein
MRTYKNALLAIPAALLLAASPLIASAERGTTPAPDALDALELHSEAMARMVFQGWLRSQAFYGLLDEETVEFRVDERTRIQRRDGSDLVRDDIRPGDEVVVLYQPAGHLALTLIKL